MSLQDMLLQLGHMEDIMDLLEPAREVKSICHPSYAFCYPEWSQKPRSELLKTCKIKFLRGQ